MKRESRKRRSTRHARRSLFIEPLEPRRVLAALSGFVFIDIDDDGVRDAGEVGVPGALVQLSGNVENGQVVEQSSLTQSDGSYSFTDLPGGTYELLQQQPAALFDGIDSTTVSGATVENDRFTNLVLQATQDSVENNFGERGLKPEYAGILWFFASTNQDEMLRESIALGEDRDGDSSHGDSIRNGGSDVPPDTNASPIAVEDSFTLIEDQALTVSGLGVLANDSDTDGDSLTARMVTDVDQGTLTLNEDGSFTYTPNPGFVGSDSFSYQADDGTRVSNPVTVTLSVTAAEDDTNLNIFSIDENSAAGSLVGQLTPEGETGDLLFALADSDLEDELRLVADDHLSGDTTAAVVLIEYLDLQCPFCQAVHPIVQQLEQDFAGDLLVVRRHLPLTNIHPNAFAAARLSEAAARQGSFDAMADLLFEEQKDWELLENPESVFESYASELGLDLIQLRTDLSDPTIDARINRDVDAAAALGTSITPTFYLNGQLVANPGGLEEFTPLIQAEVDANDDTFSLDRRSGEIFVADSSALDFETTPTFDLDVIVSNGSVSSLSATINLTNVNEVTPVASADNYVVDEGDVLTVTSVQGVLSNDIDAEGDSLTAILLSQPSRGTVVLDGDGAFTYTPNAGFTGSDSFTYDADDGEFSATATVTIVVSSVNDAPLSVDDQFDAREDQPLDVSAADGVLMNDSDPDGDSLLAQVVSQPVHGTLSFNIDGSFTYEPDLDYTGTDSFAYQADDGVELSDPAVVTITVFELNTFAVVEGAPSGTFVGQVDSEGEIGDPVVFEIRDADRPTPLELAPDDHLSGNLAGTVTLIEYLDFQCPACAAVHPIIAQLENDFADDLLVVRRHLPLIHTHDNAFTAAQAVEAAGRQGMFDEMADLLFANQADWESAADPLSHFESYASSLGLDVDQLRADINDPAIEERIVHDLDATNELAISSTPTFYLGSERLTTNPTTLSEFSTLIEAERDALQDALTINRRTGELFVANGQQLDFETLPTFQFTVNIHDGSSETVDATTLVLDAAEGEHVGTLHLAATDQLLSQETDWLAVS